MGLMAHSATLCLEAAERRRGSFPGPGRCRGAVESVVPPLQRCERVLPYVFTETTARWPPARPKSFGGIGRS